MFKKTDSSPNIWMSFADLITGSLVVFMLITVVLVIRTRSEYVKVDESQKKTTKTLQSHLKGIDGVQVTSDGVIRFYSKGEQNENVFFNSSEFIPLNPLKEKLNEVWPQFEKEIRNAYEDKDIDVKEIRIEGHTDSRLFKADVHGNLGLSQKRAAETWFYIRDFILKDREKKKKKYVESKVVSVGFGEQKLLNSSGELILKEGGIEDMDLSRRIELSVLYESSKEK